jgi:purine-cytosine permease-like protein
MFAVMGLVAIGMLGITSPGDFWDKACNMIWKGGAPQGDRIKFTFWHVMCFAWFGNIAWHIGMGDLTLFRYAKRASYGLASAAGMFLGHYMAWIAAGLLYALQLYRDPANTRVAPDPLAYDSAGIAGIVLVLIAGWTTANPILYRAGLAFQSLRPTWSRAKVTLIAGAVASVIGIFPALNMQFLNVAALYGLVLMPMGAVIFADHYLLRRFGRQPFHAERIGTSFYLPPAIAWVATLLLCVVLNKCFDVQIFFLALPGWFVAGALYVAFSLLLQRRSSKEAF